MSERKFQDKYKFFSIYQSLRESVLGIDCRNYFCNDKFLNPFTLCTLGKI